MMKLINATGLLTVGLIVVMICGCAGISGGAKSGPGATRQDVEKSLQNLAGRINPEKKYSASEIYALLEDVLHKNERIFGAAWAIPLQEENKADLYYIYADGQTYVTRTENRMDTTEDYMGWYRIPLRGGGAGWSRPYQIDDGNGNRLSLITYSLAIKANDRTTAVIACDYLIKKEETQK